MIRKIIHIDEEKCNGCGLCATACHEGAIDIINGKAKLVRENFCFRQPGESGPSGVWSAYMAITSYATSSTTCTEPLQVSSTMLYPFN